MNEENVEDWVKEEAIKRERAVQDAQARMEEERDNLREQQARGYDHPADGEERPAPASIDILAFLRENLPPSVTVKQSPSDSPRLIGEVCDEFRDFLVSKNKQYGDSAIDPVRVFSKASPEEQLKVRMDDKLSRLVRGDDSLEPDEDIIKDLLGYWILLQVVRRKAARADS